MTDIFLENSAGTFLTEGIYFLTGKANKKAIFLFVFIDVFHNVRHGHRDGMRLIAASRLNCSVTARCCCNVDTIISITAVSDRPMLNVN